MVLFSDHRLDLVLFVSVYVMSFSEESLGAVFPTLVVFRCLHGSSQSGTVGVCL